MSSMKIMDPRLEWFSRKMRAKLATPKNVAKSDPREMPNQAIFKRIIDEVNELSAALITGASPEDVISECCDVSNFCMMLADKVNSSRKSPA